MKRLLASLLVLAGTVGVACYQDDTLLHAPAISPTKVFLTDDPFPYDTVRSVNIFVTKIEGSTGSDTTFTGTWATIATPNKSFDLLTLQQGDTAFVGQGVIDAGKYVSIRMTIDADQSSIKYQDGTGAVVQWTYPGHGAIVLYAVVQQPVSVSATGTSIVIDFDVGRTFVYNPVAHNFVMNYGTLRAVNSAITGAIAGHVTQLDSNGTSRLIPNADVSVFSGGSTGLPIATGRTDGTGTYKVGFLDVGSYLVLVQHPRFPWLSSKATPNVTVTAGGTSTLNAVLPPLGTGSSFLSVTGPDSVSKFAQVLLHAVVIDSHNAPVPIPVVTWITRDSTIARIQPDTPAVVDSIASEFVAGVNVGTTWIVASSGTLVDSLQMRVTTPAPPPAGVKTVTLSPASLNIAVNDSVYFVATLRDSSGNVVSGSVYWSILPGQDSTVGDVFSYGLQALICG